MTVAAMLKHKGHEVVTVQPSATIAAVARLLSSRRIGAVVVRNRKIIGRAFNRETLFEGRPNLRPIQARDPFNRSSRLFDGFHYEARDAVFHHFRY